MSNCEMCDDKEWMILYGNPTDRSHDIVAPCLGCSGSKNLNEIKNRRGVEIKRNQYGEWIEVEK